MLKLILVCFAFTLCGCLKVGVTRLGQATFQEKADCNIEVLPSKDAVQRPYVEACLLDTTSGGPPISPGTAAKAIENAKYYACQCGADALIINSIQTYPHGILDWGGGGAILTAIKYTDQK